MRLQVYAASTRPLLEHYERLGLLSPIGGIGRTEEIEGRILDAIGRGTKAAPAKRKD
jgi:adenylate kinase family enzyme